MTWILFTLALVVYYALHSLMASLYFKNVFGKVGIKDQSYRILFNLVAIGTTACIFQLYRMTTTEYDQIGSPFGYVLVIAGVGIVLVSIINYDLLAFLGIKKEELSEELVKTGLNNYLRHPLYFGILIGLMGWLIVTPTGASFSLFSITFLYVLLGIHLEEKKLIQQFGKSYEEYKEEVPKLIPRFRK